MDPYCRTMTTVIAPLRTGRKYVRVEKRKDCFDVAMNRLRIFHFMNRQ